MYTRLSPETVNFITKDGSKNGVPSYTESLDRYVVEITSSIHEVCDVLSNYNILDHDWSVVIEKEADADEQLQLTIYQKHSRDFFSLYIDETYKCYWSYNCISNQSVEFEILKAKCPSFNRYFWVNQSDEWLIISSTFSKRQLISRYFVDYIVHLSRQLVPLIQSVSKQVDGVAA